MKDLPSETRKPKRKYNPKLLTAAEAAERMGVHRNTILWNIRRKYLKAEFDGFKYSIDHRSLGSFRRRYYESAKEE